jgi:hypothetical protein
MSHSAKRMHTSVQFSHPPGLSLPTQTQRTYQYQHTSDYPSPRISCNTYILTTAPTLFLSTRLQHFRPQYIMSQNTAGFAHSLCHLPNHSNNRFDRTRCFSILTLSIAAVVGEGDVRYQGKKRHSQEGNRRQAQAIDKQT